MGRPSSILSDLTPSDLEDFKSGKALHAELGVAATAVKTAALAGHIRHTHVKTEITLYSRSDVKKWLENRRIIAPKKEPSRV